MRHEWVFDVLKDLQSYALRNDLPGLASRVKEALAVAEVEVAGAVDTTPVAQHAPALGNDLPQ